MKLVFRKTPAAYDFGIGTGVRGNTNSLLLKLADCCRNRL
jgi:hypothetical protein